MTDSPVRERGAALNLTPIRERCEKATPGPWVWRSNYLEVEGSWEDPTREWTRIADDGSAGGEYNEAIDTHGPDADFIAHARTDIPALLAEVERLRRLLPPGAVPRLSGEMVRLLETVDSVMLALRALASDQAPISRATVRYLSDKLAGELQAEALDALHVGAP